MSPYLKDKKVVVQRTFDHKQLNGSLLVEEFVLANDDGTYKLGWVLMGKSGKAYKLVEPLPIGPSDDKPQFELRSYAVPVILTDYNAGEYGQALEKVTKAFDDHHRNRDNMPFNVYNVYLTDEEINLELNRLKTERVT